MVGQDKGAWVQLPGQVWTSQVLARPPHTISQPLGRGTGWGGEMVPSNRPLHPSQERARG